MFTINAITDPGLVKDNNEDYYLYSTEKRIIIVADGVGGYAYGEVASKLAVNSCYSLLESELGEALSDGSSPEDTLNQSITFANKKILDAKVEHPHFEKMRTTLACAYADDEYLYYSHIGDSRVYLINTDKSSIELLTTDHTLSKKLIDKEMAPKMHQHASSILTRVVGAKFSINPESGRKKINKGDYILLCTDGLSDFLNNEAILSAVLKNKDRAEICLQLLVSKVKEKGAKDNVSIVLARYG